MRRAFPVRALTTAAAAGAVLAGLLGSAPQARAATTVPSWLIPLHYTDEADGSHRACTGITLSRTRTLATPDCFTGRSHADMEWDHDLSSGRLSSGVSDPRYRSHPTYDAATRRGAVSVAIRATPASYGKPVLASSADTALYASGAKATFYSWSGLDLDDAPRVRHSEQVVLKSAASCAALLGRTLPSGTLCTVPAPGRAARRGRGPVLRGRGRGARRRRQASRDLGHQGHRLCDGRGAALHPDLLLPVHDRRLDP